MLLHFLLWGIVICGEIVEFVAFELSEKWCSMGMKNRKGSRFFLIFKRHVGENMRTCKYQFSRASDNGKKST